MDYIKGVNLGNWLVLEKWMSPELFDGTTAEDETYLCLQLSEGEKRARLKVHRDSYVTMRDFAYLASLGINTIRIPVPFFLFEDHGPYVACSKYLDQAFDWAERYGLKILVDLHTVPGSQNGSDNAGICGICQFSTKPEYVECALSTLERIAIRYGNREGLFGVEVLNEPAFVEKKQSEETPDPMEQMDISAMYPAVDKEAAKKNERYDFAFLSNFYRDAYRRLRQFMPIEKVVVFHDAFRPLYWKEFFAQEGFENIVLDTHIYLMMADFINQKQPGTSNLEDYLKAIEGKLAETVREAQSYVPVVVGEWCLSCGAADLKTASPEEKKAMYRKLADAQLAAWKNGSGYFYWSYKLHICNENQEPWDFGKSVAEGWISIEL